MAETEVESILREIRERVLSQQRAGQGAAATMRAETSNGENGAGEAGATRQLARPGDSEALAEENLALINSYLTTTARAWDRLPPLVSNRSGPVARIELWLKRRIRAGTHWFTWEQVNFNAAVHYALRDMLQLLSAYEQEIRKLRAQIDAETSVRVRDLEQHQTELHAELRQRDEHLRDEQRVCFKQLALETSEAAVLEDRARRKTEALLEDLTRRVEELDKR
jgi:multidrug resistance efflux pump